MSSANTTTAAGGAFAPVTDTPQRVTADEIDVDLQNLSDQEAEIVTAEEFIIFGRCNIEQWNRPGPGEDDLYIEMDALEGNLDQLLALENISIGHNDVRIGEPRESHTLDTDATVHLDSDETLTFAAGDDLRTEVIREGEPLPGDNGTADEDALWLVANLFGREDPRGSRFSQKARLGAYYGELDGFSVTADKTDMTFTEEGTVVHDVDFLAVTVGPDGRIKNPGSSFGVAEFQALFGDAPATDDPGGEGEDAVRPGTTLAQQLTMSGILQRVFGSSRDALASQAIEHAYDEGTDLETAVEQAAGDENYDAVMQAVEDLDERLADEAETIVAEAADADAVEDRAADLADELGVDKEVVMAAIEEIKDMNEDMDDDGNGPPDGGGDGGVEQQQELADRIFNELPDDANVSVEELMDALDGIEYEALGDGGAEAIAQAFADADLGLGGDDAGGGGGADEDYVTADAVEQMIDERLGDVEATVEEQLDALGEDVTETLSQQLQTGATPGPTGGGVDRTDLAAQLDDMADEYGLEVED